jgi:UDP-N-acetylglucosamine/UDP-N-acetylgalactosamine diphosphorylase
MKKKSIKSASFLPLLKDRLEIIGQTHLLSSLELLENDEQHEVFKQLESIDEKGLKRLQEALLNKNSQLLKEKKPFLPACSKGAPELIEVGKKILKQGQAGCIVLAGGMGSRLRFDFPKGLFPITCIKQKTLFQRLAERVKAASHAYATPLHLAIMTSSLNHAETQKYFLDHQFFGLESSQISFFPQEMWPSLDLEGNLFCSQKGQLSFSPAGNGSVFRSFMQSNIALEWKKWGIEMISIISIDNPLADPFDANLLGFHASMNLSASMVAIKKRDHHEKVGVLVQAPHGVEVCEYSEISGDAGSFSYANTGHLCFTRPFFEEVARCQLPIHLAFKSVQKENKPFQVCRCEQFIFDAFCFAKRSDAIIYPRNECFAPLKNFEGEDSIKTVEEAVQAFDRDTFYAVTGQHLSSTKKSELDPAFYYPDEKLKAKWRDKKGQLKAGYIEA